MTTLILFGIWYGIAFVFCRPQITWVEEYPGERPSLLSLATVYVMAYTMAPIIYLRSFFK